MSARERSKIMIKKHTGAKAQAEIRREELISTRVLMEKLGVGRSWLRKQEKAGMPRVCLNPDSEGTQGRRYRYSMEAVLAWLNAKAGCKTPVPQEARQEAVQRLLAYLDTIPEAERGMLEEQIPNLAKMREEHWCSMEEPAQRKGVEA